VLTLGLILVLELHENQTSTASLTLEC